jgi:hypothetical protein
MMVSGMIVVVVVLMPEARHARIAQHHFEPAVDRRKHEARGNECAQAEHRENERHGPMTRATSPRSVRSRSHGRMTMRLSLERGKWEFSVPENDLKRAT